MRGDLSEGHAVRFGAREERARRPAFHARALVRRGARRQRKRPRGRVRVPISARQLREAVAARLLLARRREHAAPRARLVGAHALPQAQRVAGVACAVRRHQEGALWVQTDDRCVPISRPRPARAQGLWFTHITWYLGTMLRPRDPGAAALAERWAAGGVRAAAVLARRPRRVRAAQPRSRRR